MSSFFLGFIIGVLATGLVTGVYIAYLLGKKSGLEKQKPPSKKKTNKIKNKKKTPTGLNSSDFGGGLNQVKFPVSSSIKSKKKNR